MFRQRTLLSTAVVAGLALSQSACTLIGFGIGAAIDAGNKQSIAPERFEPDTIKPGQKIGLKLRDGYTVGGRFIGIEQLPLETYSASYAEARDRHITVVALPELGDTVTLRLTRGIQLDVEFLGFDLYRVSVRTLGRSESEHVRPRDIDELRVRGDATISGDVLALLLSEGALPFRSAVAMQTPPGFGAAGGKRLVPLDQITRMEWKSSTGRTTGLVVGGILDLAIIAVAAACSAADCLEIGYGSG